MKLVGITILVAAFAAAQVTPAGGTVEGTVINSATGAGIGGASVLLFARQQYETTSDAQGHFKITGMAPGGYRSNVAKDGFAPISLFDNPEVPIAAGPDPVKLELKLTPLSTVRGRVLRPDGTPAPGVEVNLNPNMLGSVVTDQEGRYELEKVKPGSYTLSVRLPGTTKPEFGRDGTRTAMVTTYYPSVPDRSLAQQIVFQGQGDLNGYDIRMQAAPVHRVRGIVLDEEGKPSAGASLLLFPSSEAAPGPMGFMRRAAGASFFLMGVRQALSGAPDMTATAGKDGRFEFPAVPSGDWRINVESTPGGSADVRIAREDLDDFQIHVARPLKLTGAVEWKGEDRGNQMAFGLVTLVTADRDEFVGGGYLDKDGIWFERVMPGRYKAIVRPGILVQIFLGETEVTGQTFAITVGGPRFHVVPKISAGTVRGTVENGQGATVVLIPQRTDGVQIGQTIVCGPNGSFELNEVSPGDYFIAAFDRMDGLFPPPPMLSLLPLRGTSVRVEEGAAASVTLSVNAAPR